MSDYPLIIIGGGLSGLAAGIRFARFDRKVLILERHSRIGGLNSYYYRQGRLFETGLHAITNYAPPEDRRAPLNRLFRQLKLSRHQLITHEQLGSEILFPGRGKLAFTNDFNRLTEEVANLFPKRIDSFLKLVEEIEAFDAFSPHPRTSARDHLTKCLQDDLLIDMLLCPLSFYGSSEENDMDFSQFVIMFRSIFLEGMFRPAGTIKDLLDLLVGHYQSYGGEIRLKQGVKEIMLDQATKKTCGVRLDSGEEITCDQILSTAGHTETLALLPEKFAGPRTESGKNLSRLSFTESIYLLPKDARKKLKSDKTIIFYNLANKFHYRRPTTAIDLNSGVICFPDNFHGLPKEDPFQLRVTHMANYDHWRTAADGREGEYRRLKEEWGEKSKKVVGEIIGNYQQNIVYEDSFTPVTIEKFTAKSQGAIYGSPDKIKDGRTGVANLFIAGTDQGFLGIVGAMLSGVSIINQHIL